MSDTIPGTTGPDRREIFSLSQGDQPIPHGEESTALRLTLAALPLNGTVTLRNLDGSLIIGPGRASSLEEYLLDEDQSG